MNYLYTFVMDFQLDRVLRMKFTFPNFLLLVFTMFVLLAPTMAQNTSPAPTDNSLSGQFDALKGGSESYKQYKVIDRNKLNTFWKAVQDSIVGLKQDISTSRAKINELQEKITNLDQSIANKDNSLAESTFEKEHIKVIGIDIAKGTYISINFTLIFLLVAVLCFFVYKYNNSNKVTVKTRQEFSKLDKSFEDFKRDSLDKQMKLRRELQTERNKIEELYQKVGTLK